MITLVLTTQLMEELSQAAQGELEVAGVLLVRVLEASDGSRRLLGRAVRWVPEHEYIKQETYGLVIPSTGYVAALAHAEKDGDTAIWFHTHPGWNGTPIPSRHDHEVDRQIADLFRIRTGSSFYGTLIVSPRPEGCVFTGTLQHETDPAEPIERLWVVGDRWKLVSSLDSDTETMPAIFDRNIRAFGPAMQQALSDLRVAIVGCGGTGSSVAEQLVRLGVRKFTLIDGDTVSESNVTRLYGSTLDDVGKPKVEVVGSHLRRIAPDAHCTTIDSMITLLPAAFSLTSADLIFGCTDDNAGRLVLSRLSSYLLTPVLDVGVLLSSVEDGTLSDINGRITVLSPGSACLVCRDRIDLQRASAELMDPEERHRLQDEGYAPALGAIEPAVVAFTTAVAAAAVAEMIERLVGYGPVPRPSEVLLRFHEREVSTNSRPSRDRHYCHMDSNKWGWGAGSPFLEQTWPDV
ncbi:ThiF family adenylyltransferase [Acidicapsa dinghuensis]|uniref:ThiF family adenylyltransferase n=1 Tax=Acidicapsa dinghuensis TaxID=2218256 RepID=A0ABW1ECH4_9BACT|nr:ThiF family adenylyltransferase [Acidicapsa dinghuensis]